MHELRLSQIVQLVDSGALALPDFQRPYVWREPEIRRLIATVLSGWPAGLLLLMEAPADHFFATRRIEGGPPVAHSSTRHLVLMDSRESQLPMRLARIRLTFHVILMLI
jgi:hypothetical protein